MYFAMRYDRWYRRGTTVFGLGARWTTIRVADDTLHIKHGPLYQPDGTGWLHRRAEMPNLETSYGSRCQVLGPDAEGYSGEQAGPPDDRPWRIRHDEPSGKVPVSAIISVQR